MLASKAVISKPYLENAPVSLLDKFKVYVFPGIYPDVSGKSKFIIPLPLLTTPAWQAVQVFSPGAPVLCAGGVDEKTLDDIAKSWLMYLQLM